MHALLSGAIDYAGLFPPAGLDLSTALANYRDYSGGPDAWALGRFVVRAESLPALEGMGGAEFPLSVLIGPDLEADLERLEQFSQSGQRGSVKAVEVKAPVSALDRVPAVWQRYVEVPIEADPSQALEWIDAHGAFAKVRTGGVVPEAIPHSGELAMFLVGCARFRLGFKATAGLHHPIRGGYPLTYEAGSPCGTMFGYLNLALAAAIAWTTADGSETEAALSEAEPGAITWDDRELRWRSHRFSAVSLQELRRDFFHGFGSCSFREPLDELAGLGTAR